MRMVGSSLLWALGLGQYVEKLEITDMDEATLTVEVEN